MNKDIEMEESYEKSFLPTEDDIEPEDSYENSVIPTLNDIANLKALLEEKRIIP